MCNQLQVAKDQAGLIGALATMEECGFSPAFTDTNGLAIPSCDAAVGTLANGTPSP